MKPQHFVQFTFQKQKKGFKKTSVDMEKSLKRLVKNKRSSHTAREVLV